MECSLATDKQSPWKAPGPDGIAAYWLKGFGGLVERMMSQVEAMIEGRDGFPHWFVRGRTVLIPKRNEASEPTDFRPITYLNSALMALSEQRASPGMGGPVDVNAFATFWEDIWGAEGEADPQDDAIVEWGEAVLIPKVEGATEPGQFRPITCLNCGYKAMTMALTVILHRAVGTPAPGGAEGRSPR